MKYLGLGQRLKKLREKKSLSISELSQRSQISVTELDAYESQSELPRIGILIRLAKALQVNVADILRDRPVKKSFELIRSEERKKINPFTNSDRAKPLDYLYEPLVVSSDDKHLDAYLIEVPPLQDRRAYPDLSHPGEEFVYILEGRLILQIKGEDIELSAGDSIYLRSENPHLFFNPFDQKAKALTVIYPF